MITEHTRVECRVLCLLARGAKVVQERDGVYSTGPKRSAKGKTRAEFIKAGGHKADFQGARITFSEDLYDRLLDKGLITEAGNISKAGREYVRDVRARALAVCACDRDDADHLRETMTEHGYVLPGLGLADTHLHAARVAGVIAQLQPEEGV